MTIQLTKKLVNYFEKYKFLFILLSATFLVRLPSLFEPLWYRDEAIYLTIGQKILRGGELYFDIFDHKTPGIYYLAATSIAALGQTIWSFRFLLMVWFLITLVVFFFLAKKLFDERVAKISSVILAALTATPLIEGNITNSEILMILPVSLGILTALHKRFLLSGIFFSFAFLIKFPSIFDLEALLLYLLLTSDLKNIHAQIKRCFTVLIGFALPILLSGVYFSWKGVLSSYIFAALIFNFSYLNSGDQANTSSFSSSTGLLLLRILPLLVLIVYLLLRLRKTFFLKTKSRTFGPFEFILLWLFLAYYGVIFGGRSYPHYLIQVAPAFSLLIAFGWVNKKARALSFGIVGAVLSVTILLGFKTYLRVDYYPNFIRYLSGQITTDAYMNSFDPKTARDYSLASFLKNCKEYSSYHKCLSYRTSSKDNIYIWGDSPAIYFLSQRDPTSKYITAFHVAGNSSFKKEVITSIQERKPKYILVEESAPDFPKLDKLVKENYNLFAQTDDVQIFELLGNSSAD